MHVAELQRVIPSKYDSCYVLPASAVSMKGSDTVVYVKQGDRFVSRTVNLGAATHGQATVLSGIQDGEVIATRNPFETRKARLPDFSKATAGGRGGPPGPPSGGGPGGMDGGGGGRR